MTDVRPLRPADLDWVAEVAAVRRERLAAQAPRLWRPAADAVARHRAFVERLLADDSAVTVRTDHGYLVALGDDRRRVVDDLVVADGAWAEDGASMLCVAFLGTSRLRVTVPESERERRDAVRAAGLVPVETWWHRDLPPAQVRAAGGPVQLTTDGAVGRLVPAPPVHDPGGEVLLVTEAASATALGALESAAAERGATVSVVTQRPEDLMRELLLVEAGHVRTATFYETIDR